MNTKLKNVDFGCEVRAFLSDDLPKTPMPILYALVDSCEIHGATWIHSDEAKAMIHTLSKMAYGPSYHIEGQKEQARLAKLFKK